MIGAAQLSARLGLAFVDQRLLDQALVHRSYLNEHPLSTLESNERLEFLGDSVLNMVTAAVLYQRLPASSEGQLTSMRAALVKTATLAEFARQLSLGTYLRMSKGEESGGGRDREALLADTFEAVVAAIFLDQGLAATHVFLGPLLEGKIQQIEQSGQVLDYKSRLQETMQALRNLTPQYRTVAATGPDHQRQFTVEVWVGEELLGVGTGHSKQVAAQAAAFTALEGLRT